jgi:pimeloyl-ACP methyl ester carboxylesterase
MTRRKNTKFSEPFQIYVGLSSHDIKHLLDTQVGVAEYLRPGIEGRASPDHIYQDSKALWLDVLADKLGPTTVVTLEGVYLLEWFPRAPGLYYTPEGAESREEALGHVVKASDAALSSRTGLKLQDDFLGPGSDVEYVFDPYAKISMLRGGIGCFRLKGRTLRKVGTMYFLSASSSGVAHKGFLIGMPESLYSGCVDQIKTRGAIRCSITGRLQQIPKTLVRLFDHYYRGVPEIYLLAEDVRPLVGPHVELSATAAVAFASEFEGRWRIYATYATFQPGNKESLERAYAWLESFYIHHLYRGEVITDFDETVSMFEQAPLGLSKILENKVDMREVTRFLSNLELNGSTSQLEELLTKIQSNIVRTERQEPLPGKPIVISLHGIRTRGAWQKRLSPALAGNNFIPEPLDYGFFRAIQLVIPSMRDRKVKWLLEEYTAIRNRLGRPPSIIAHSLGSYLVARLLEKYEEVKFDRIILCGSIVNKDYPWTEIFERKQVTRVLNDYGGKDVWAKIAQWVVNDAGPSGTEGFNDRAGGRVLHRFRADFRHSDFFYSLNYEKSWIPFLQGRDPADYVRLPERPANWKFRAILIAVLISLFLALGYFVLPRSHQESTGKSKELPRPMPRVVKEWYEAEREAKRRLESDPDKLTLHDLFITDFSSGDGTSASARSLDTWHLESPSKPKIDIESLVVWSLSSGSEFISFYIPRTPDTHDICVFLIPKNFRQIMQNKNRVVIDLKVPGQSALGTQNLVFTNRIYIFHETNMTTPEQAEVEATFKTLGVSVILMSSDFLISRIQQAKLKLLQKSK